LDRSKAREKGGAWTSRRTTPCNTRWMTADGEDVGSWDFAVKSYNMSEQAESECLVALMSSCPNMLETGIEDIVVPSEREDPPMTP